MCPVIYEFREDKSDKVIFASFLKAKGREKRKN
jgi:hypothetical protein